MSGIKPEEIDYILDASPDHLWLTEASWKSLLPTGRKEGDRYPVPKPITERILYQLGPTSLYGEGGVWSKERIRSAELHLVVEEASASRVRLRLEGAASLRLGWQDTQGRRDKYGPGRDFISYEPRFMGSLEVDPRRQVITRFSMVALGDVEGRLPTANFDQSSDFDRPGRNPVGFAFELVRGDVGIDRIAPTGRLRGDMRTWYLNQ